MGQTVRPRDAAGLIVARGSGPTLEVLLGRRHPKSRFMPDVYVFPGGRLSAQDRQASGFAESLAALPVGVDGKTRQQLTALARAAIREFHEETGLLIASPNDATVKPAADSKAPSQGVSQAPSQATNQAPIWQRYRDAGHEPAFLSLRLVARAITPVSEPIRFHSRFFCVHDVEVVQSIEPDGELMDIGWIAYRDLHQVPFSEVHQLVLEEALCHLRDPQKGRPAALFAWSGPNYHCRYRQAPLPAGHAESA